MQGVTRQYVRPKSELSTFSLKALGIGTEDIPQPIRVRRSKGRQDEANPSTAPPPLPSQSNWHRLFSRLDDIDFYAQQLSIRMSRIEHHLDIPPPHGGHCNEDEKDD